jgi:hypothetical protein
MISLPDGAPVPPGSIPFDPPAGFEENRRGFAVVNGRIEPVAEPKRKPLLQLTQKEIARIKAAIKAGKL